MTILRKAVTTLGGVFLAVLLITALAPRAVRGITATLVQVTNTSASPVPTVSDDANFPYEALICSGDCNSNIFSPISASFAVPSATTTGVPVKRLVIEDLSASCVQVEAGPGLISLLVPTSADSTAPAGANFLHTFLLNPASGGIFAHEIVRLYVDPSATVTVNAGVNTPCFVTLTGHLETK
jgi:hypothetical protein